MKKILVILFIIIILLTSCEKVNNLNSDNLNVEINDEISITKENLHQLENLEITPWEFVEKYPCNEVYDNTCVYFLADNYELHIDLGINWNKTYVGIYDREKRESMRLFNSSSNSINDFYARRNWGEIVTNNIKIYSSDKKNYVTYQYKMENRCDEKNPNYYHYYDHKLLLNDEIELMPKDEILADFLYEYISFSDEVIWSTDNEKFAYSFSDGKKFEYMYDIPGKLKYKNEKLFYYMSIFNTIDNSEIIISMNKLTECFENIYDVEDYLKSCSILKWSPDSKYLLFSSFLEKEDLECILFVYDYENNKILYHEIVDPGFQRKYIYLYSMYNSLYEYDFDWSKIE